MLCASLDAGALYAHDRFFDQYTRKVGIRTETFPVPSTEWRASKWPDHRTQGDMSTLVLEFCAHVRSSTPGQISIPRSSC